jgi:cell division protein FtsB
VQLTVGRRRLVVLLGLLLAAAAVLAVPAQSYWAQRGEVAEREAALAEVQRSNDELQARLDHLEDPDEVQRIARRDFGLVAAEEESYSILPPATAGLVLPQGWPFDRISGPLERAATGGT